MKRALLYYHHAMNPNLSDTLSDTPACAHGINSFIKYNKVLHPPSYTENTKKEEEEENTNTENTAGTSEAFDEWFDKMPLFHGYRPGRDDCLKEWRRQQLDSVAQEVIAATKRFKRSKSWRDGYNPMPISFLKNKRWLDAPPEEEDFFVAT